MDDKTWINYVASVIDNVNKDGNVCVNNAHTIQKFTILPFDFSLEEDELTPTLKFKRSLIEAKVGTFFLSLFWLGEL